jgi:hypothetical protein
LISEWQIGMSFVAGTLGSSRPYVHLLLLSAGLIASPAAKTAGDDAADDSRRNRRLETMQRSAAAYTLFLDDDRAHPLKLVNAPVLRWANPENLAKDGTVFIWTSHGRPQAILGLFTYDDDNFSHEWQSLAERPLTAKRGEQIVWNPNEPGIRFTPLKDVDPPASTAAARLRQMKALAARFSATFVSFGEKQDPLELRLLPQPLHRYDTVDNADLLDGALFAFVQGTDPQALLVLEARHTDATAGWHFAFARMASGAITGRYQEQEVFSVAKFDFRRDPRRPFLLLPKQPAP